MYSCHHCLVLLTSLIACCTTTLTGFSLSPFNAVRYCCVFETLPLADWSDMQRCFLSCRDLGGTWCAAAVQARWAIRRPKALQGFLIQQNNSCSRSCPLWLMQAGLFIAMHIHSPSPLQQAVTQIQKTSGIKVTVKIEVSAALSFWQRAGMQEHIW